MAELDQRVWRFEEWLDRQWDALNQPREVLARMATNAARIQFHVIFPELEGCNHTPDARMRPAGVAEVIAMTGACPCSSTGEHSWLPWWTSPSGQSAHTKCVRCHRKESVSVLP